jgi:hypothetical protein
LNNNLKIAVENTKTPIREQVILRKAPEVKERTGEGEAKKRKLSIFDIPL